MAEQDRSYRHLFGQPRMVADLLRGFVREPWVDDVDLATLERVSGSYVSDKLKDREDDTVWRVRYRGDWLYVYVLIEFQSDVDPFMVVRMLVYVGLLYQHLIEQGMLTASRRLPPVLPVVVYNGEPRWSAPLDMFGVLEEVDSGLEAYRPSIRYLLLDEGRCPKADLADAQNLVAQLIRLEQCRLPEEVQRVLTALIAQLGRPEEGDLRRAFAAFVRWALLPRRMPDAALPEVEDLEGVRVMLAERVKEWTRPWVDQGMQQGRQEGEARIVLLQLEDKFGPLPESTRERVSSADTESLDKWARRVLSAERVEDVFN